MTADDARNALAGLGPIAEALTIPAAALATPGTQTTPRWQVRGIPQALGFAWINDTGGTATLTLAEAGSGAPAGGLRVTMAPHTMGTIPGCWGSVAVDPASPTSAGVSGTIGFYWCAFVPPFAVRRIGAGAVGTEGLGNTLTLQDDGGAAVPSLPGLLLHLDVRGNFTGNALRITSPGPAWTVGWTTISGTDITGSEIEIWAGDQVRLGVAQGATVLTIGPEPLVYPGQASLVDVDHMVQGAVDVWGDAVRVGRILGGGRVDNAYAGTAGLVGSPSTLRAEEVLGVLAVGSPALVSVERVIADLTITAGIAGGVTVAGGSLTASQTVSTSGLTVVGTAAVGSAAPRYTFDQLLVDNTPITVAAGAMYNSAIVDLHGLNWAAAAASGVTGTSLNWAINLFSFPPLIYEAGAIVALMQGGSSGITANAGASTGGGGLGGQSQMPTAANYARVTNSNTTDSLTFNYLEVVGG